MPDGLPPRAPRALRYYTASPVFPRVRGVLPVAPRPVAGSQRLKHSNKLVFLSVLYHQQSGERSLRYSDHLTTEKTKQSLSAQSTRVTSVDCGRSGPHCSVRRHSCATRGLTNLDGTRVPRASFPRLSRSPRSLLPTLEFRTEVDTPLIQKDSEYLPVGSVCMMRVLPQTVLMPDTISHSALQLSQSSQGVCVSSTIQALQASLVQLICLRRGSLILHGASSFLPHVFSLFCSGLTGKGKN